MAKSKYTCSPAEMNVLMVARQIRTFHLGIDPGACTGIAICCGQAVITIDSGTFWEAKQIMDKAIDQLHREGHHVVLVIEDPNLNRPVFKKRGTDGARTELKVAQNVGMNKAHATLWIDYFRMQGLEVITVRPTQSKKNAAEFNRLTGWNMKTNQHERDAAMLVYGR